MEMACVQPVRPRRALVARVCRMFQGVLPRVTCLSLWTSLETAGGSVMSRGFSLHGRREGVCLSGNSLAPPPLRDNRNIYHFMGIWRPHMEMDLVITAQTT